MTEPWQPNAGPHKHVWGPSDKPQGRLAVALWCPDCNAQLDAQVIDAAPRPPLHGAGTVWWSTWASSGIQPIRPESRRAMVAFLKAERGRRVPEAATSHQLLPLGEPGPLRWGCRGCGATGEADRAEVFAAIAATRPC